MSRKEEIEKWAEEYALKETITDGAYYEALAAFKVGAEWADAHPKKGLVDIDKACEWLRNSGIIHDNSGGYERESIIEEFRKAMET